MKACLHPQISWRLIYNSHQAEKKRYWENRKHGKPQSKER